MHGNGWLDRQPRCLQRVPQHCRRQLLVYFPAASEEFTVVVAGYQRAYSNNVLGGFRQSGFSSFAARSARFPQCPVAVFHAFVKS